jgi:hypothetical protein
MMRDLLDRLDSILTEANLLAGQLDGMSNVTDPKTGKIFTRPELFLYKVKNSSPFTLDAGGEVVIDPKEASRVRAWIETGPIGTIKLRTMDRGEVVNTKLKKTLEFGSKESQTIPLKGSDIFDTEPIDLQDFGNPIEDLLRAGGFPASEMYSKIADNPKVKSLGKVGEAIVAMAAQVNNGQIPEYPDGLSKEEKKAIELYASEYLGVLGLISGATKFPDRAGFNKFMGRDFNDVIMFFPKSVSNPLADSFSVVNDETGHAIKISSKAGSKGAPPSLNSIKLSDEVRKKYPDIARFYDFATDSRLTAFKQPFAIMNWLNENYPDAVPAEYAPLMPFTAETVAALEQSFRKKTPVSRNIMRVFNLRLTPKVRDGDSTDGGKAWYAVITDIMTAINDDNALPDFQKAVIQSLGENFIQLYTKPKGKKLETTAFWPAKIKGQAVLKTKSSSKDPVSNKISVEVSPGKLASYTGPETTGGGPSATGGNDMDQETQRRSSVTARSGGTEPSRLQGDRATLGRKRRNER